MTKQIPLGQSTAYPERYDRELLFPVDRQDKRTELGITQSLPFVGKDIWTAYEVSWLNSKGKPQVAIAEFYFPCESPFIVESKSFKLYLNSFNQERLDSMAELKARLITDLSEAVKSDVDVLMFSLSEYQSKGLGDLTGTCLDELDIDCEIYDYQPELLTLKSDGALADEVVYSHLLKSNCLITSQPDWATLQIRYQGNAIDHASLLRYIVSFRNHNEFHEQCVERIYTDIMQQCQPKQLTVIARYTRRGGLDINPWRSSHETNIEFMRLARQ